MKLIVVLRLQLILDGEWYQLPWSGSGFSPNSSSDLNELSNRVESVAVAGVFVFLQEDNHPG